MVKFLRFTGMLLLCLSVWGHGTPIHAVKQTLHFLSLAIGSQDTSAAPPGIEQRDDYLAAIEEDHGAIAEDRIVSPLVISFDFYQAYGSLGSGFGIDIHRYQKSYTFEDGSKVNLSAVATLYGFVFYYRGDWWFPFFGFGSGTYTTKVVERLKAVNDEETDTFASFTDAAPNSAHYKLGVRFPLGEWGWFLSWQAISAELKVRTINKYLQLGGQATLVGIYYGF